MNPEIKVIHNFFNFHENIYTISKKLEFYNCNDYKQKFNDKSNWPGIRTQNLINYNYTLYTHIISFLNLNKINTNKYKEIRAFCHVRFSQDNDLDWVHTDPCDTALIYLSPTNLESGTSFFADDRQTEISTVKFIQNTCVFFTEGLQHRSVGNHGQNIDDARMTFNVFMYK
tara:strand:+ start:309 stop:821 length:513 start_codon:yes stop_codon:yes gene_type:complete